MAGVIPEWADKKAERVMTMFAQGDTAAIDRALLHGAVAAALCEERERCANLVEARLGDVDPELADFAAGIIRGNQPA